MPDTPRTPPQNDDSATPQSAGGAADAAPESPVGGGETPDRREALGLASSLAMGAGLVASYGTFGAYAVRYLYPAKQSENSWRFIAPVAEWPQGKALEWRSPDGRTVTIVRQNAAGSADDFIALSDVCPHLGCRVHWEAQNDRFFCPCHNGAFDAAGKGISGPPGDAGQTLPRYELRVDEGRLFLGIDLRSAAAPDKPTDESAGEDDSADGAARC
jgi:nitrite reductase/ring-hydroxylating ferredoxin subunit